MSLKEHNIKSEYRSLIDNVIQDFYLPLLHDAAMYRRAVGFFSSSSLVEISKGIGDMAQNGGRIEIVASPYLSDDDLKAIKAGYENREKIIEGALIRQISDEPSDYYSMERLNLLANLIADGIMDIRIAYTDNNGDIGMYHEKMGIIEDSDGNHVAFSGSMNESMTAMSINYETIDVFCDWKGAEADRVQLKENAFHAMWNNVEPSLKVLEFPKISETLIEKYRRKKPNFDIDKEQFYKRKETNKNLRGEMHSKEAIGPRIPDDISLHDYQEDAITVWVGENYRGIFDMATGTGKTYTGLGAISKLSMDLGDDLAVIIVAPYKHLVEQWVDDIVRFNMKPIVAYGDASHKDWRKRLSRAVLDQKIRKDKRFFCVVCTNATFTDKYMQEQISKIKSPILLVVDEAHNFGARSYAKLLDDRFTYRLALSATLERHRDEEGTAFLYDFFGKKCIEYTLERAIAEDKLTPYKYYPVLVYLSDIELESYEQLSYEMSKCVIKGRDGRLKLNKHGEILALKRSRVVAGAIQKLDALREVIEPYKDDNNILVYCGATRIYEENEDSPDDETDIRQIEAVTKILGNELGMSAARFTSEENMEQRALIKEHFQDGDLQAIVAIKCLDEGVNIPGIRTAFILASTTNPKEYIQRRGRVLRKAPNKPFAEIYDFVTLPRPLDSVSGLTIDQANRDITLVKNELARIKEFGRLAMNSMEANNLIWDIEEAYHLDGSQTEEVNDYE
ncbi:Superfamily II DNA or RNA helicase [Eubacterium pyruvativorans]|uniref:Superfamily II DNA or RNA helicase n=1 Tax=Eubacterium pyruvativorans TaxID=155865 RepID=A0A1I7I1D8_9FIRM|nr:DEAD/DEAH box helicase family protein [Eubacterium pyruvativorans]SFO36203.1 Superfamily II DNA or RNA helicase [Eubacterium pyruvativorans]SFU66760.1 Superfamily II DNA or RNA helicase [Eubacterium pyruvativorans]